MYITSLYFVALMSLPVIIHIILRESIYRLTDTSHRLRKVAVPLNSDQYDAGYFAAKENIPGRMERLPRKGVLFMTGILLLAGTSCIDDIKLNLDPEQYSRLVVQASVTDTDSAQTVILTRTIPYDRHKPTPPATGAMITIEVDGKGYLLEEVSPGYYESRDFTGQVGKTYILNILYEDETYTASSTMHQGFETDSIGFKKFPMGWPADVPHYEILIYSQDPAEPDEFFLFKHSINGVWADTLLQWSVYTDVFNHGEYLDGESVAIIESRADSLEVQVMSMSISEDYAWFINDVIINYMPNMFFSPPKANVQGNISNGAFGFFQASSVNISEKKMLYRRDYFSDF